ncbi:MAG: anti-sigma factor [Steroidobacteraceae bacterium]
MKRNQPEILELLAAEYVLGTLCGAARRRFERWRDADPFVGRRVRAWEERLAGLAFQLEPIAPSPGLWTAIERRTGLAAQPRWRAIAAAVAAVAILGLGWFLWQDLQIAPPQAQALIAGKTGETLWRIEVAADGGHLEVTAVDPVSYPDARSLELWALPAEAAPVSLGLMPSGGSVRLALDERQRAAIGRAENVAVSEEPVGGSPTGAPTGPVLYVAAIARS